MVQKPDKTAPFVYFFAGAAGEKPADLPAAWHQRFYVDGAPFPDYPHANTFPPGCTIRHIESGPGGSAGLLATPFTLPPETWGTALAYPPIIPPYAEVEIEAGVWLMVAAGFEPYDVMRMPLMAPDDVNRWRGVTTKHTEPKHQWIIPCCLPASAKCVLPMIDRYQRGAWVSVPRPEYRDIAAIAETLYRAQCEEIPKPDRDWLRHATCAAIAVNYEITPAELGALDLLDDNVYGAVEMLLTDFEARTEAQKKTV